MTKTSNFEIVSTRQQRIAELAKQSPQMGFTSLNHFIDRHWLREAYRRTRKDGAVGVDGQTAAEYEVNLEDNLQYVLDDWFAREVQPRLTGRAFLIRYADDAVIGFADEGDAQRVMDVLPKRFSRYGLRLHPEKTRLVRFIRPPRRSDHKRPPPGRGPETFELLGFTHHWGLSRRGNWVVKRKTAPSRFARALRTIARWCRFHRHRPIAEQHQTLCQKLCGHFAYYGITSNALALVRFRHEVARTWRKWISRRRRDGTIPWSCFNRLLERYPLPRAVVIHSVYRRAANP